MTPGAPRPAGGGQQRVCCDPDDRRVKCLRWWRDVGPATANGTAVRKPERPHASAVRPATERDSAHAPGDAESTLVPERVLRHRPAVECAVGIAAPGRAGAKRPFNDYQFMRGQYPRRFAAEIYLGLLIHLTTR